MSIDLPDARDAILADARTTVPVLIPWRTDDGARAENWELVEQVMWELWPLVEEAAGPDGPFNRSAALNEAYRQVDGPCRLDDVVIVADADSIVPRHQLADAILVARASGRMTIAHDRWLNVERHERDHFLATGNLVDEELVHTDRGRVPRRAYKNTCSSMLVIPTKVWDRVGGFDERFVGWGMEDIAFNRIVTILCGKPERIRGPVYHLEHERAAADRNRSRDAGYRANRALWHQYRRARTAAEIERVRWPGGLP